MFVNSIDQKPFFTRPDGSIFRDLTETMFNLKNQNYVTFNIYRVPKDYVMRPDLISKAVYNNSMYAEMILKYNGISNPFSINEGDLILVPSLEGAKANINKQEGTISDGAQTLRNSYKYIDPTKIPKKSKEMQQYENRQIVTTNEGALPPNFAPEGTSQITYRNGRVYFNDSVGTCLKNGSSTSEFLSNIIKSKGQ
jgi:hypothetical protein